MRLVVADTGPIHYLILIEQIDLIPKLFEQVFVPSVVRDELAHSEAPQVVRAWISIPPPWLAIIPSPPTTDLGLRTLDDGERAAIELAGSLHADAILMDDRAGVAAARARGFAVTGTIGILDSAARHDFVDFAQAVERLRKTNFHCPEALLESLLKQHGRA
jgi:predicted nucleic acid-binding protein